MLKKAFFEVYGKDGNGKPEIVSVLFNPAEYTISGGAEYSDGKDRSGNANEKENYKGSKERVLSLELFFDTTAKRVLGGKAEEEKDVSDIIEAFMKMISVSGEIHTPPLVCFVWGRLHFKGHVSDVSTQYLLFNRGGTPLRAKMELKIKAAVNDKQAYENPFQSPDRTKARQVTQDRQVWDIAQAEYKDPDMWRLICQANHIKNPLDIPAGTVLKIPALD